MDVSSVMSATSMMSMVFLLDDCVDNKDMHGFSASKSDDYGYHSVSFYSTERVNHDDMMDLLRIFGL